MDTVTMGRAATTVLDTVIMVAAATMVAVVPVSASVSATEKTLVLIFFSEQSFRDRLRAVFLFLQLWQARESNAIRMKRQKITFGEMREQKAAQSAAAGTADGNCVNRGHKAIPTVSGNNAACSLPGAELA
jgi:hypothetical protein